MNENNDFRPIKKRYYPGPYSSVEFGTDYHVAIHYFSNSDRKLTTDAAYYLQQFYGGELSKTKLRKQINKERGIFRDHEDWNFSTVYPVSIFSHHFKTEVDFGLDSPYEFALDFVLRSYFMDEVLIIKSGDSPSLVDYLIAVCRYRQLPVYYLEKDNNSFIKKEILEINEEDISEIDKNATEEFEDFNDNPKNIILIKDRFNLYKNSDGYCFTTGNEEYVLPKVPLQLLKRLDEWHRLCWKLGDEVAEKEYKWLVGALNYFLKGKYIVMTEDGSLGLPLSDLDKPLDE